MTVSARAVAAVLRDRLPGLPTKKLHKLLYYCQGHHLAAFGSPLFSETISAWDMGPVVGQLWYQEREENSAPSSSPADLGEAELNTVGYVVSRYGALTGTDLENLTHSESPWQSANKLRRPHESVRIEESWLTEYFRTSGAADNEDLPLDSEEVTAWLADAQQRRSDQLRRDSPEDLQARLTRRA